MATLQGVYADLVGQEHVVETLIKAVQSTRTGEETQEMTHAWVFTGPPGSGRSSAAVAFAQALVCTNNGCGTCNECKSAANGAHPDVEIIRTEGLSIKIDEGRAFVAIHERVVAAEAVGMGCRERRQVADTAELVKVARAVQRRIEQPLVPQPGRSAEGRKAFFVQQQQRLLVEPARSARHGLTSRAP